MKTILLAMVGAVLLGLSVASSSYAAERTTDEILVAMASFKSVCGGNTGKACPGSAPVSTPPVAASPVIPAPKPAPAPVQQQPAPITVPQQLAPSSTVPSAPTTAVAPASPAAVTPAPAPPSPTAIQIPTSTPPPTPAPSAPAASISTYMVLASPTSVNAGASVTATWNSLAGNSAKDWVGLFKVGDSNRNFIGGKWVYTGGLTSGTFTTTAPTTPGTYEFRFLQNDGYTDVARSSVITVTAAASTPSSAPTLTPTPTPTPTVTPTPTLTPKPIPAVAPVATYSLSVPASSVNGGASVTVNWTAPSGSSAKDWVGLYKVGDSNNSFGKWTYTNAAASGSYTTTVPTTGGNYEFRYLLNDGYTDVARSNAITVAASSSSPPPPSVTPTPAPTPTVSPNLPPAPSSVSGGNIYYVSSGVDISPPSVSSVVPAALAGNDINPGTKALPFKTLQKALSVMKAGDTLIVRGGEYDTVNGLVGANGWGTIIPSGTSWENPVTLKAYSGEKPVLRRFVPQGNPYTEDQIRNGVHMPTLAECVAQPGWQSNWSYPYDCWTGGMEPNAIQVPVATYPILQGYVLQFWGPGPNGRSQYIVIDGIDIDARGITSTATFSCGNSCGGTTDDGPLHIKFQNLEVRNSVMSCFSEPGWSDENRDTDFYFINTKIHHCGAPFDTSMIGGRPARLNTLARFRHAFYAHTGGKHMIDSEAYLNSGTGVGFVGVNNSVSGSYVHDNATAGIYVSGDGWTIENNIVADNGTPGGIEIYVLGDGNHTIRNNTIIRSIPSFASKGIWLNSRNVIMENNLIVGPDAGIWNESWSGPAHTVRNNLILSNLPAREIYDAYSGVVPMTDGGGNIKGQDPKLLNFAAGDYHLQLGSPAIDKGYPNGLTTDHAGNPRPWGATIDIGAYEYGN